MEKEEYASIKAINGEGFSCEGRSHECRKTEGRSRESMQNIRRRMKFGIED